MSYAQASASASATVHASNGSARAGAGADVQFRNRLSADLRAQIDANVRAGRGVGKGEHWGAEQTANRILDFAKRLASGDPAKLEKLRAAAEKGSQDAQKLFGNLPDVSHETMALVRKGFDALLGAPQQPAPHQPQQPQQAPQCGGPSTQPRQPPQCGSPSAQPQQPPHSGSPSTPPQQPPSSTRPAPRRPDLTSQMPALGIRAYQSVSLYQQLSTPVADFSLHTHASLDVRA